MAKASDLNGAAAKAPATETLVRKSRNCRSFRFHPLFTWLPLTRTRVSA